MLYIKEMKDIPKQLDCEKKHEIVHVKHLKNLGIYTDDYEGVEIISVCEVQYKILYDKYNNWFLFDDKYKGIKLEFQKKARLTEYLEYIRTTPDGVIKLTRKQKRLWVQTQKSETKSMLAEAKQYMGFVEYRRFKREHALNEKIYGDD